MHLFDVGLASQPAHVTRTSRVTVKVNIAEAGLGVLGEVDGVAAAFGADFDLVDDEDLVAS